MGIWHSTAEEMIAWARYVERKFPRPPKRLLARVVESVFRKKEERPSYLWLDEPHP